MTILEQIGVGLLTDVIGLGMGLLGVYLLRNRLRMTGEREIMLFFGNMLEFVKENPEILDETLSAVIGRILNRPGGIMPKEATIKLPLIGKVPASWAEPAVRAGMERMSELMNGLAQKGLKQGAKKAEDAVWGSAG